MLGAENKRQKGKHFETLACEFLEGKGFKILERNWYFHRLGEIDIIAKQEDLITFVEVRAISSNYTEPAQILSRVKQRRFFRLINAWLQSHGYKPFSQHIRADVIVIKIAKQNPEIVWLVGVH